MLKKLVRALPHLVLALAVAGVLAFLDANVFVKMMHLVDFALKGDLVSVKAEAIPMMILAILLVPMCVLTAVTKAYYKRKANLLIKEYYVKGVFDKNISEFHKENNAKYLSALTNDVNTLENNLVENIYQVGFFMLNFASGIWMISTVTPWIILVALGVMAAGIIFSMITSKPVSKHTKERSNLFEGYTSYIKEVLSAFHIIKNNNLQERIQTSFNNKSTEVQQKGYVIDKILSYIQGVESILNNAMVYGLLAVSGYMAIKGIITLGGALLVVQGLQKVMWPIMNLVEVMPKLFTVKDLMKKIEETLKNEETYVETLEFEGFKEKITLENVTFGYEDGNILEGVNLELKQGGKYLIVGPSGGGKSTLLKLLRKYFNPSEGDILIDGQSLKDIKKGSFFSQVANVEQQVFIFEDTLRNNITLYKEYTDAEIEDAITKAGLKEFIKGLPDGLDTMIYDNGKNISGGERSRVVIARGLLAKASIIFLDEAFAALDMERAKEIEKSILALEGVTVINVSHVLFKDTSKMYDKVLKVNHQQVQAVS